MTKPTRCLIMKLHLHELTSLEDVYAHKRANPADCFGNMWLDGNPRF